MTTKGKAWAVAGVVLALLIIWSQIMHAMEPEKVPYYLQTPEPTQEISTTTTVRERRQLSPAEHDANRWEMLQRQRQNERWSP